MKNINTLFKTMGLVLFVAVLVIYGIAAANRAKRLDEYEKTVAQIEAENEEVLRRMSEDAKAGTAKYADGIYEGRARGFGGDIAVKVTVENGRITDIAIVSASGEDNAYLGRAKKIIDAIISAQSAEVDAISGATYSSTGIRNAVALALAAAER